MKLIIQIPCYNEEETLRQTLAEIPREIAGVDQVEILIVDDGSTDRTVPLALQLGVDHIVQHRNNKGLARAFRSGIEASLAFGADVIVNTDGDNQYPGRFIPQLIAPILAGEADIVVGDRRVHTIPHFSPLKRLLQKLGSATVRLLSGTDVPDTVSGFRALSREAAIQINIVSPFSYTIEMLIQAGRKQMAVASVPIETNLPTRRSRLFKSLPDFLFHSGVTIVRMYAMYRPLKVFFLIGGAQIALGLLPVLRFLYFYFASDGAGHVQSLLLGGVLLVTGFMTLLIALISDLISFNRQLVETTLEKVTRMELRLAENGDGGRPAVKAAVQPPGEPFDEAEVRRTLQGAVPGTR